ncbi:glycosyltransferase [Tenacibaculum geojense]|uniref:Glycosyltransferase n=1 Tax=Tenacibaculum geojense TaxID=915352 RepID=A0ABW3JS90_9FLAO
MKRIIVSVSNDLTTDQRVMKTCNFLHANDYEVVLIGRLLNQSTEIKRNYTTKRFNLLFNKGPLFYIEYNIRLFCYLLTHKKEVLFSNDLDTLLPNYLVSKIQNKKLIFDSHELFSEIPELVYRKRIKWFWKKLESFLIPKIKNGITVSDSIANYYQKNYNANFITIKNLPYYQKQLNIKKIEINSNIIIYQGAVNIGRGLELMIDTMEFLDNYIFLIIGDGDIISDLKNHVSKRKLENKVLFYGKVTPKELKKITPNASLGISLEEDLGLNYRYALPNKIFDYVQAEVPVLVSNLPEMKKIVKQYNIGEIVYSREPQQLANQITQMCTINFLSKLQKAKKELIWEKEAKKLTRFFN